MQTLRVERMSVVRTIVHERRQIIGACLMIGSRHVGCGIVAVEGQGAVRLVRTADGRRAVRAVPCRRILLADDIAEILDTIARKWHWWLEEADW